MHYIADFHIHSHFSLATSKELAPESLNYWAALKGIKIVGTGDFTHPGWLKELKDKLLPAEQGLFKLKDDLIHNLNKSVNPILNKFDFSEVRFLLTAEISNIYKKAGKTRKIHNVVFAPDFDTVDRIQNKLSSLGFNITSDGRPIMGLDARDLLEILLDCSPDIFFIPAHIWTPWFSVLGANSGYDSVKECYGDLADNIFAVETGLSSDPPMNWLCSFLDDYTLVSNSDAHSPEKLGRNANIFDTDISYNAVTDALKTGNPHNCHGTIDMYPQEGKYHYAGHSKCGVCWSPAETDEHKAICPVCGKKVTNGVMNRVVELSDRQNPSDRTNRLPFHYAIPLKEIISEITGVGPSSRQLVSNYNLLLSKFGSELNLLLNIPARDIAQSDISVAHASSEVLAEAINRMRNGNVIIRQGFDGQYGKIRVFEDNELKTFEKNMLFINDSDTPKPGKDRAALISEYKGRKQYSHIAGLNLAAEKENIIAGKDDNKSPAASGRQNIINSEQTKAINHFEGPALVIAGPGTGKTFILTHRILNLIKNKGVSPENILAVTFTNKAADEMKKRVINLLKDDGLQIPPPNSVMTFHSFGLSVLKEHFKLARRRKNFFIIDENDKQAIVEKVTGFDKKKANDICKSISDIKQNLLEPDAGLVPVLSAYEASLVQHNCFDFDDLIFYPVRIFDASPQILGYYRQTYKWLLIDEYQDINLIQYQLVKALMPSSDSNLFAIGDPNQAIYGFRGADVRFIRQFVIDNPKATVYHLRRSYRCTDKILKASGSIINENIFTHSDGISVSGSSSESPEFSLKGLTEGIKINIVNVKSDKSEAEFVARTIEKMLGGLRFFSMDSGIAEGHEGEGAFNLSDFAVLCRLNRQFNVIEKALRDHAIPFQSVGEVPFFRQEPVDNIIDFLKYYLNPDNTFIKDKLIKKKIIQTSDPYPDINRFRNMSVTSALSYIINLYFRNEKNKDEQIIKKLFDLADDFSSDFNSFLEYTSIGNASDAYHSGIENVSLMTLHASKGLEFKCVFIVGCEEGIIPYSLFGNLSVDEDEEKRVLYVGMTRAKSHLFLSHASHRFLMGKELSLPPSHLLKNIEEELAQSIQPEKNKKNKKDNSQLNLF